MFVKLINLPVFQHTAARRRLARSFFKRCDFGLFQHTAARRRLDRRSDCHGAFSCVSTHSRPKAAGSLLGVNGSVYTCFNTQPPEGGWRSNAIIMTGIHQVSTHSRPKAAGCRRSVSKLVYRFQHTAARRRLGGFAANDNIGRQVSTHSRPKAAGICFAKAFMRFIRFQHTAARRRLVETKPLDGS